MRFKLQSCWLNRPHRLVHRLAMQFLKLTVAYDGSKYVGWQVQKNGISIQQKLEEAWEAITQEKTRITASGRTDAGVHAIAQICSLQTDTKIDYEKLPIALNANTPFDITVLDVVPAPQGFHAIRDALGKTYRYQIQFGRKMDPLQRNFRWFIPKPLDIDAMETAAGYLIGEYDFASFQSAGSERNSTVRNVTQLELKCQSTAHYDYLDLTISANGFLYNMVRNIVGTLVRVGQGTQSAEWVKVVLDAGDRRQAGQTAPAHGLFLLEVNYDN